MRAKWTLVGLRPGNGFIRGILGCNYALSENAYVSSPLCDPMLRLFLSSFNGSPPENSAVRTFHPLCAVFLSLLTGRRFPTDLATAWETSALFDAFIFVLTLMRTLKIRKMHHMASGGLVDILLRDGKRIKLYVTLVGESHPKSI